MYVDKGEGFTKIEKVLIIKVGECNLWHKNVKTEGDGYIGL